MAAGQIDVARRSGVHYSKKDTYYYRNSIDDHGPSRSRDQRIRRRNGYSLYLGAIETDDGRGVRGFGSRTRNWELGELSSQGRSNDAFISGSNETSKFEGGVSMPSEKKRKLSPVVWDRDEKEVRISSKNRPFQKSVPLCSPPYLPESFWESTNVASDGDMRISLFIVFWACRFRLLNLMQQFGQWGIANLRFSPIHPIYCHRCNARGITKSLDCWKTSMLSIGTSQHHGGPMRNTPEEIMFR
ncbi:uncharacterized protein LOC130796318 [Actinidia eriantha]|uniref:uncharacterized protein LOC130796318 n=1 Tax=Actinidia eriantha TaxID=165200 RepID=UPI00258BC10A|nr:uncharacterized protein LOC130796318 [Actinidia eriantha]